MSQALRMTHPDPYREPAERVPRPAPRREAEAPPYAPRERRAVPMTARELLPLAAILMLVGVGLAMTVLYLAAFATGAGQARRELAAESEISQLERQTSELETTVRGLERRSRIEAEAARLGLIRVEPASVDMIEAPGELTPEAVAVDVGELASAGGPPPATF